MKIQSESDFFIPEDIKELAENPEKARIDKEEAERRKEQEAKAKEAAIQREWSKIGLECAEKIWAWTETFRQSSTGKKIIESSPDSHAVFFECCLSNMDPSRPWLTIRGFVIAYYGLVLSALYERPGSNLLHISSARELAARVDPAVLKRCCEHIDSGKIWEVMKKHLLRRPGCLPSPT